MRYKKNYLTIPCLIIAVCVLSIENGRSIAFAIDPCNSERTNSVEGGEYCGTITYCKSRKFTTDPCTGMAIWRNVVYRCVQGGSSSQRCENRVVICTRTYYCKVHEGSFDGCIWDLDNPVLDPEGEPVVSYAQRGVMVSCIE